MGDDDVMAVIVQDEAIVKVPQPDRGAPVPRVASVGIFHVLLGVMDGCFILPLHGTDAVAMTMFITRLLIFFDDSDGVRGDDVDLALLCCCSAVAWESEQSFLEIGCQPWGQVRLDLSGGRQIPSHKERNCSGYPDLVQVRGGGITESMEFMIQVIPVEQSILTELDALGDGSADTIYLGEEIVSRCSTATGHPGWLVATSAMSSSETRCVMVLGKLRSYLALVVVLLSKVEALEIGFLGTVTSGKLP